MGDEIGEICGKIVFTCMDSCSY